MPKRTWSYPDPARLVSVRERVKQANEAGHTMTKITEAGNISPPTYYKLIRGGEITTEMYERFEAVLTKLGFPATPASLEAEAGVREPSREEARIDEVDDEEFDGQSDDYLEQLRRRVRQVIRDDEAEQKLAEEAGLSRYEVTDFLNGEDDPTVAGAIADVLELFEGSEAAPPDPGLPLGVNARLRQLLMGNDGGIEQFALAADVPIRQVRRAMGGQPISPEYKAAIKRTLDGVDSEEVDLNAFSPTPAEPDEAAEVAAEPTFHGVGEVASSSEETGELDDLDEGKDLAEVTEEVVEELDLTTDESDDQDAAAQIDQVDLTQEIPEDVEIEPLAEAEEAFEEVDNGGKVAFTFTIFTRDRLPVSARSAIERVAVAMARAGMGLTKDLRVRVRQNPDGDGIWLDIREKGDG